MNIYLNLFSLIFSSIFSSAFWCLFWKLLKVKMKNKSFINKIENSYNKSVDALYMIIIINLFATLIGGIIIYEEIDYYYDWTKKFLNIHHNKENIFLYLLAHISIAILFSIIKSIWEKQIKKRKVKLA